MSSFRGKFEAGLARRSIRVTHDPREKCDALLIIAGTRHLRGILDARRRGVRIVQRLDGITCAQSTATSSSRSFARASPAASSTRANSRGAGGTTGMENHPNLHRLCTTEWTWLSTPPTGPEHSLRDTTVCSWSKAASAAGTTWDWIMPSNWPASCTKSMVFQSSCTWSAGWSLLTRRRWPPALRHRFCGPARCPGSAFRRSIGQPTCSSPPI